MENKENNSNSGLKIIIGLLSVLLITSLGFIYKISSEANENQTVLTKTLSEKETVMSDLQQLKVTYDAAIAEKTSMSEELIAERDKVIQLINNLEQSKGDVSAFKSKVVILQNKMKSLITENEGLKSKNKTLSMQRDSTVVVLGEAKKYNEELAGQNEDLSNSLSKTIEKGSKLSIVNLQTNAYIVRSSGKMIPTDKASRADVLKINFTIAENQIARSGEKQYYVQIIDSKNNVIGDKQQVSFEDKSLTYSVLSKIRYENKTVIVEEQLAAKELEKGTYFINVFDKSDLVSKSTFSLN